MAQDGLLGFMLDLLIKIQTFAARPSVQAQLAAIAAILVGISILTGLVGVFVRRRQKKLEEGAVDSLKLQWRILLIAIRLLAFPLLTLITTNIVTGVFNEQNRVVGLLEFLTFILSVLLAYRIFLLVLYLFFSQERVRRFQGRLFNPLFALFVGYQIISLFVNVTALATVGLYGTDAERPITLGALFVATIGLYFWVDSILGFNEVIYDAITRTTKLNPGRLDASLTLGGNILMAAGIMFSLSLLGVSSTTFAAILGGLSVGIGFGLKEVLSNFISGILLIFEGSIKPGDSIEFRDQRVIVKKMGIRATYVETMDNIEIIVPNQELLVSPVISHTATDSIIRVRVPIPGSYEHAPEKIIQILEKTVKQNSKVLQDRKNKAIVKGFSNEKIDYELHAWIDVTQIGPAGIKNQLYHAISKAFAEHNIELPIPQQDIKVHHLTSSQQVAVEQQAEVEDK